MSQFVLQSSLMERLYSPVRELGSDDIRASSVPISSQHSSPRMSSPKEDDTERSVHGSDAESLGTGSTKGVPGSQTTNGPAASTANVTDLLEKSTRRQEISQRRKQIRPSAAPVDGPVPRTAPSSNDVSQTSVSSSQRDTTCPITAAAAAADAAVSNIRPHSPSCRQHESENDSEMQRLPKYGIEERSFAEFESETIQKQKQELQLLIAELRDRDRELNEMVGTHQRQIDAWHHDRRRAVSLEEKCSRLQKELQCRNDEVHMLSAQMRVVDAEQMNRRTALDSTRDQLATVTEQHSRAQQQITELESHRRRLSRTVKQLQSQIQQCETREQELLGILASKDRDLSDSSSNVSELSVRLKKSEQLIGELRLSEAELKRTNAEATTKNAELRREIEHFKKLSHRSDQHREELKAEIQRLKEDLFTSKKEFLLACEREKRKDQLLALQRSKQERTDAELTSVRELYERQQRDFSMLQLNFESTKQLLTQQQQKSSSARHCQSQTARSSLVGAAATSHLLPELTDDDRDTKSFDGISSYQHAMKILSSEMLPERETTSAAPSYGSAVRQVHSPAAEADSAGRCAAPPSTGSARSYSSSGGSDQQPAGESIVSLTAIQRGSCTAEEDVDHLAGSEVGSIPDSRRSIGGTSSSASTVVPDDDESDLSGRVPDQRSAAAGDDRLLAGRPFLEMTKTFAGAPTNLLRWSRVADAFSDRRCQSAMELHDSCLSLAGSVDQRHCASAAHSVHSDRSGLHDTATDVVRVAQDQNLGTDHVHAAPSDDGRVLNRSRQSTEQSVDQVRTGSALAADESGPTAANVVVVEAETDSSGSRHSAGHQSVPVDVWVDVDMEDNRPVDYGPRTPPPPDAAAAAAAAAASTTDASAVDDLQHVNAAQRSPAASMDHIHSGSGHLSATDET